MLQSINTNLGSLNAQNQLGAAQASQHKSLESLSSGKRINSAATDPAGSAIVQIFAAQIAGSNQAASNLNDGVSLTEVADGNLAQLQSNTDRLRELAVAAGNGTLSGSDREALQAEANQLTQSNADIVQQSSFNGVSLLQGGATLNFQSGPNAGNQIGVTTGNLSATPGNGGLFSLAGGVDLSSAATATQSIDNLDADIGTLSSTRANFGAASSQFSEAISNLQTTSVNLSAAQSRINDTDYAAESSNLASANIRAQAALAVQAQANAQPQTVLSLLGR